jgi:branched-chain amino acid transport system substrate-binding protein
MMGTFGFPMRSKDFWRLAGPVGNGFIWPATHYRPSWPGLTEVGRWFTSAYRERYGTFPPDTSLSAFTDVTTVVRALADAPTQDRDGLVRSLEAREYPTWRGPVRFERNGDHLHHDAAPICLMQYRSPDQDFDEAAIIWPPDVRTQDYAPPKTLC